MNLQRKAPFEAIPVRPPVTIGRAVEPAPAQKFDVGEAIGRVAGVGLAPLTLIGAALRDARLFHPEGRVYRARVVMPRTPFVGTPVAVTKLANHLLGHAILRLSSAWWKSKEWPDVLGVALRFSSTPELTTEASETDQDLLFASSPSVWALPISTLVTDVHDFLHNRYFAISRYRVPGLGRVDLSLAPLPVGVRCGSRAEKLEQAVQEAQASFQLRVQDARGRFFPIVDIELTDQVNLDQSQLRFSPFHAGRGLDPVGFVHGLRWAAYAASRLGSRMREAAVPGNRLHAAR